MPITRNHAIYSLNYTSTKSDKIYKIIDAYKMLIYRYILYTSTYKLYNIISCNSI